MNRLLLKVWLPIAIVMTISFGLFIPSQAHAGTGKFTPDQIDQLSTVLSYDELAALPMAKRQEYIVGLRGLVYELELKFANGSVAGDMRKKLSAQIQFLNLFIGDAEAQSSTRFTADQVKRWEPVVRRQSSLRPKSIVETEANYQLTTNGFRPSVAYYRANESDPGLGCPAQVFSNAKIKGLRQMGGRIVCSSAGVKRCPMYYRPVAGLQGGPKSGGLICARGLDEIKARQAAAAKAAAAKSIAGKSPASEAARLAEKARRRSSANARLQGSATDPSNRSAASDSTTDNADEAGNSGAPDAADASRFAGIDLTNANPADIHVADGKAEAVAILTEAQRNMSDAKVAMDKFDEDSGATHLCGSPPSEVPQSCTDGVAAAKEKYYNEAKGGKDALFPHCLYAGNITHFKDSIKKPGNCRPENEFCLNGLNCRNAKGSRIDGASSAYQIGEPAVDKHMKCKSPSDVICNPLLFDLDANDDPFCVSRNSNATVACFAKSKTVEHKQPLIFRLPNVNGIIDGWNAFKTAMDDMCFNNETTKAFFCVECHMMKVRLFELKMATKMSKGDDAETKSVDCFKMFRFNFKGEDGSVIEATGAAQRSGRATTRSSAAPVNPAAAAAGAR